MPLMAKTSKAKREGLTRNALVINIFRAWERREDEQKGGTPCNY